MVGILKNAGSFPNQYWNAGVMEGWEALSADTLHHEHQVKPRACPNCFIACSRYTTIKKGRHQGLTIEGPEYETIYAFGVLCLIKDIGEVSYLNNLFDNLGLGTITSGNVIAFLMEATARGVSKCPVRYGDADRAAELLNDIAQRRGIGALLAEGVKAVAQEWGCEDLAIHVKAWSLRDMIHGAFPEWGWLMPPRKGGPVMLVPPFIRRNSQGSVHRMNLKERPLTLSSSKTG
jgi:aldehyde:ferredoxin oxidoreductase